MDADEDAIRALVDKWIAATKAGDTATVLELIADDALFMVSGGQIFGKQAFAVSSDAMRDTRIEGGAEILEIEVAGNWAWIRNHIDLSITPSGGEPLQRSGYALTIFKKGDDGRWRLFRDANFVN